MIVLAIIVLAWLTASGVLALLLGAIIRLGKGHPSPSIGADVTEADDAVDHGD